MCKCNTYTQTCIHTCSQGILRPKQSIQQLAQLARWVSFGQTWKTGTGRQYFADIMYVCNVVASGRTEETDRQRDKQTNIQTDR